MAQKLYKVDENKDKEEDGSVDELFEKVITNELKERIINEKDKNKKYLNKWRQTQREIKMMKLKKDLKRIGGIRVIKVKSLNFVEKDVIIIDSFKDFKWLISDDPCIYELSGTFYSINQFAVLMYRYSEE